MRGKTIRDEEVVDSIRRGRNTVDKIVVDLDSSNTQIRAILKRLVESRVVERRNERTPMTRSLGVYSLIQLAFVPKDIIEWEFERAVDFVVKMVIPWYFNLFMSWQEYEYKIIVRYEDLNRDVVGTVSGICNGLDIAVSLEDIEGAIAQVSTIGTRRNRMVVGRGESLPQMCKSRIIEMASFYKDVDFSSIGI